MSAGAAMGMMLAGGGTQAISQYQSGQAQKAALNDQANQAELQAANVDAAGRSAVDELKYQQNLVKGQQEEDFGGGGVATGGSTLDLMHETAERDARNLATTQFNYDSQAYSLRRGAQLNRFYGQQAARAGMTNAIGTLLTTGAQAYFAGASGSKQTPSTQDTVGNSWDPAMWKRSPASIGGF